jgi:hypothetical protein
MKKVKYMFLITDDIAAYFGVKVALYFAWLGHYTCALCVPAVFGTLLWAVLYGRGQVKCQDPLYVIENDLNKKKIEIDRRRKTLDTFCSPYLM